MARLLWVRPLQLFAAHGSADVAMLSVDLENMVSARISGVAEMPRMFGPLDDSSLLRFNSLHSYGRGQRFRVACVNPFERDPRSFPGNVRYSLELLVLGRIPLRASTTDCIVIGSMVNAVILQMVTTP